VSVGLTLEKLRAARALLETWPLLLGPQVQSAAAEVATWGYPRELTPEDLRAIWTSPEEGFYVWIELLLVPGSLHGVLHCAIRPDLQRRIYGRPFLRGLRALAWSLRLDALHVGSAGFAISAPVCDYLERMGFRPSPAGYTIDFREG
jgi:hypothetical protein